MQSKKGRAGRQRRKSRPATPPAAVPPFVPVSDEQIITTAELSRWVPFREITYRIFRLRNEGPPYVRVNRSILYRVGDVKAWLASKRVA
jgi:hypothetical protein